MPPKVDKKDVIRIAEQHNALLTAFVEHPQFNKQNPPESPKPLWFASDFARKTVMEFILPLLPTGAQYKSTKIANKAIFPYSPPVPGNHPPFPESENETWLMDDANWPTNNNSAKSKELFGDAVSRSFMIASIINDPVKGAMILGGQFDWDASPKIKEIANQMLEM